MAFFDSTWYDADGDVTDGAESDGSQHDTDFTDTGTGDGDNINWDDDSDSLIAGSEPLCAVALPVPRHDFAAHQERQQEQERELLTSQPEIHQETARALFVRFFTSSRPNQSIMAHFELSPEIHGLVNACSVQDLEERLARVRDPRAAAARAAYVYITPLQESVYDALLLHKVTSPNLAELVCDFTWPRLEMDHDIRDRDTLQRLLIICRILRFTFSVSDLRRVSPSYECTISLW